MDPINQVNPVLDALRRQLLENIERMRKAGKLPMRPGARVEGEANSARGMEAVLSDRLAGINAATPEGFVNATRVFVEVALLTQLGEDLRSSAGFGQLVDDVGAAMRDDPDVRARLERMFAEL
jgi:hypothetical protein